MFPPAGFGPPDGTVAQQGSGTAGPATIGPTPFRRSRPPPP